MSDKLLFSIAGTFPVLIGLHILIRPDLYSMPDAKDAPRDSSGTPIELPHRKVRLRGLFFVALGLILVYCVLFVKPAVDPVPI